MVTKEEKLINAAGEGKIARVKKLLKKGFLRKSADVNAKDKYGWTALMKAAWRGHTEVSRILVEAGADVIPVLESAASDGNSTILRILKEAGADIDARDETGDTALMKAARNGQTQIVRALIEAGGDASLVDLKQVMNNGHAETVKVLTGLTVI